MAVGGAGHGPHPGRCVDGDLCHHRGLGPRGGWNEDRGDGELHEGQRVGPAARTGEQADEDDLQRPEHGADQHPYIPDIQRRQAAAAQKGDAGQRGERRRPDHPVRPAAQQREAEKKQAAEAKESAEAAKREAAAQAKAEAAAAAATARDLASNA